VIVVTGKEGQESQASPYRNLLKPLLTSSPTHHSLPMSSLSFALCGISPLQVSDDFAKLYASASQIVILRYRFPSQDMDTVEFVEFSTLKTGDWIEFTDKQSKDFSGTLILGEIWFPSTAIT
jgi:hypothetical protein